MAPSPTGAVRHLPAAAFAFFAVHRCLHRAEPGSSARCGRSGRREAVVDDDFAAQGRGHLGPIPMTRPKVQRGSGRAYKHVLLSMSSRKRSCSGREMMKKKPGVELFVAQNKEY